MKADNDERLCNYIFGLLDEDESVRLENELKKSSQLSQRLSELNGIFSGLDSVKEKFPSPVSKVFLNFYRISCAGMTAASAMILFWFTVFGHAANKDTKTSLQAESALVKPVGVSCISGLDHSEHADCLLATLVDFRE